MDIKVDGLSYEVLEKALEQARQGRIHIMGEMLKTIAEPREDYKPFVPRMVQIEIPSDFIGAVIGKGGETIQGMQKEFGTTITIEEVDAGKGDGTTKGVVDIFGVDKAAMDATLQRIKDICAVPEAGQVYHGKVVSILEFGAFIEILPGKEGLLHVSEIAWTKTEKVEDSSRSTPRPARCACPCAPSPRSRKATSSPSARSAARVAMATGVPAATVTGVRAAKAASVAKAIVARAVTATAARAAKVVSAAKAAVTTVTPLASPASRIPTTSPRTTSPTCSKHVPQA